MNSTHEVAVSVRVRAGAQAVWDALTDWPAHDEWMPATTVQTVDGDGRAVGGRIVAYTGFGRLGFADPMEVTEWRPPTRCVMRHTGKIVRGLTTFEIVPVAEESDGSTLTWHERYEIPGGRLGAYGFVLARPVLARALQHALTRFAQLQQIHGS
ncbi:SRPBCC family protein [Actinospica robiniae]|uniref:SRPBCC family protein n=1 Tax=Actinospica robiniae TaxID=304901 RepID=UPI0003FFDDB5|nr:SRPBCC family protein [Actinospica robiniae]